MLHNLLNLGGLLESFCGRLLPLVGADFGDNVYVLYLLVSGASPYPGVAIQCLIELITTQSYRMSCPGLCPKSL